MNAIEVQSQSPFYISGGTLSRDALCYVTRSADRQLHSSLRNGQFCYVLTARQMGKSSLMVRTAARLRDEGVGVVVLDMTAIGINLTAEQWYGGLITQMAQHLGLEDQLEEFWDSHTVFGPLQRWMQAIREVVLRCCAGRVVIFIDEIDAVRSLPFSTDEFFAGIREFYNRRSEAPELERLSFCLLGVATPSDLNRDTRLTPFNIGKRIELHDFTEEEARILAVGLGSSNHSGSTLLGRILYWTNGHPYLTQKLCEAVAAQGAINTDQVDALCDELFLARRAREQDDNLLFVRERMLRSEVDLAGLLNLYRQLSKGKNVKDDETSPYVTILKLSAIARLDTGRLRVRNRIYERVFDLDWVAGNMPDAEVRRERAAYRKGLLRAAAIAGVVLLSIALLAFVAIRQRNRAAAEARRAQQQERTNRRLLYVAQMNLAARDWQDSSVEHLRDLLVQNVPREGEADLRGFEWYLLWGLAHIDQKTLPIAGSMWFSFSPDLKLVAAGSDLDIKLVDMDGVRQAISLKEFGIAGIAEFSPDGKLLAATAEDNSIRLLEVSSVKQVRRLTGHTGEITELRFSPDGRMLASSGRDHTAALWDVQTGELRAVLRHNSAQTSLAFSPDGRKLVTTGEDSTARLWDPSTGNQLNNLESNPAATQSNVKHVVIRVAFSPDGTRIFAVGRGMNIAVWDAATGQALPALEGHASYASAISFSPDGTLMATGGDDRAILLWDLKTQTVIKRLTGHGNQIMDLRFSKDSKTLASGSLDGTIKLWDVDADANPLERAGGRLVAYSADGRTIVSGSGPSVRVWDASDWKVIKSIERPGAPIISLAVSPDGKTVAFGRDDDTVIGWDMDTGKERFVLKGLTNQALRTFVAFSPDGRLLATGSEDKSLRLWDADTGTELARLEEGKAGVLGVAFSPDGRTLASTSRDTTVKLWDVATRQLSASLSGHALGALRVAFSPDGRLLVSTSLDGTIKVWDVAARKEMFTLTGHAGAVNWAAFSPDSRRLATAGQDFTVRLWDMSSGEELATFRRHTAPVWSVAFSPDGKTLVSAGRDGTMRVWRAAVEEEVQARGQ